MNRSVKKWVVRPLLIIIVSLGVLAATGFVVLSTQQERLVNIAVAELNKQLKGELIIENSKISLFKNFPYISIGLHNGRFFADKTNQGKPVCQFDRLYVGFSLPDLLEQKYNARILFLQGGYLDLVRGKDGTINLLEAEKIQPDTTSVRAAKADTTSSVAVNLKKIVVKEMDVSFSDKASGRTFSSSIDKLVSSFTMDSSQLAVVLTSDMKLDVTSETDSTLFRDKSFHLEIAADYKLQSKVFGISSCNFKLQEAGFSVTGAADLSDTTDVNFRIKGDKQDFNLFTAFIPAGVKEDLKPFQYDGRLYFDATVRGKVTEEKLPLIEVSFGCEDAWFLNTGANKKVDQLGFKGFYTNGKDRSLQTSELHIINVSARPEKGIFKGHFAMRDFTKPKALVQIKSELELKFLGEFLGIPDLKQITGKIKLDMNFKEIHDITLPEESLNKLKEGIESRLAVTNLSFQIPGYPHAVRDMNIVAEMKNGRVTVDSATLKIGDSDLKFNGSISDVRAFLRDRDKTINLALNAGSKQVILSDILSYDTALARKWNEEIRGFNISLALETTVQQLLNPSPLPKGKFEMKNLRGSFRNYPHTFKNLGATVLINDTLLRLRDFAGMVDSSDINFKGRVINYHLWFDDIKKGKTQIAFDFKSTRFAMRDVLGREIRNYIPRGYRREELSNVWLRAKIDTIFRFAKAHAFNIFMIPFSDFNAQINIAKLKYNRLWLKDVNAKITMMQDQTITVDTLTMKVAGGDVRMRGKFNGGNHEKIYFRSRINFEQVDLEKMLLKLDHFGQDVVVNKNVKGRLSGQIRSYVQVHPDLVPIMSNTKAEMTLKIYNGTLVDFAPMQAMAAYFKDKNLRLIRFDTLQNKLTFTNGVLDIPAMNINSSLGYIQVSGKQSLDLSMEYYVRVPMKMVTKIGFSSLFKRKPEEVDMSQVDEIEYMDKDKRIAFMNLKVTGSANGNFEVGLGKSKGKKM